MSKTTRNCLKTNVSLSLEARLIQDRLASHFGVNKSALVEMLLREKAREVGMLPQASPLFR